MKANYLFAGALLFLAGDFGLSANARCTMFCGGAAGGHGARTYETPDLTVDYSLLEATLSSILRDRVDFYSVTWPADVAAYFQGPGYRSYVANFKVANRYDVSCEMVINSNTCDVIIKDCDSADAMVEDFPSLSFDRVGYSAKKCVPKPRIKPR